MSTVINIVVEVIRCKLIYSDGDSFWVDRKDYDRALGTLINGKKDNIRRDFAIN